MRSDASMQCPEKTSIDPHDERAPEKMTNVPEEERMQIKEETERSQEEKRRTGKKKRGKTGWATITRMNRRGRRNREGGERKQGQIHRRL